MLAYVFVLVAVAVRFMILGLTPHPFAFTPVAAALLYFGARGPRRQLWIPFVLLAASDVVLTKFFYAYQFSWDHFVTWLWYAAILWLGTGLRESASLRSVTDWLRVGSASLTASISFFVVSNFAVWACWNMYPKTFAGLMTCYAAGIPFFRHSVAGDLVFTAFMFGVPAAAALLARSSNSHGPAAA
ncbi:MAG: DUF6580 family putative transport protein [Terriglobales bacterium]